MKKIEEAMETGITHILEDIKRGLQDLLYMEPDSRPRSLLDFIHHIAYNRVDYLGLVGGSLLEKQKGHYKVIKQFGKTPSLRTGSLKRPTSLPIEDLNQIDSGNAEKGETIAPLLYRYNKAGAPSFLKNKTIIGLGSNRKKGFNYIIMLKQNRHFKYHEFAKETINLLATIAKITMEKGGKYQGVKYELKQREQTLDAAHIIQQGILQKEIPQWKGYDIYAFTKSAEKVGGDYYSLSLQGNSYRIVLADVINHGLPASLICRTLHDLLSVTNHLRPEKIMGTINKRLCAEKDLYPTSSVYLELSKEGNIAYINNGHPYPLLFQKRKCTELDKGALLLGLKPDLKMPVAYTHMTKGEVLILYSDGLIDVWNKNMRNQWGINKLKKYVRKHIDLGAKELVQGIYSTLKKYSGRKEFQDDATLVVVKKL